MLARGIDKLPVLAGVLAAGSGGHHLVTTSRMSTSTLVLCPSSRLLYSRDTHVNALVATRLSLYPLLLSLLLSSLHDFRPT